VEDPFKSSQSQLGLSQLGLSQHDVSQHEGLLEHTVGQHTVTGTFSQTTRGTQRVAVQATCFGTHRFTWIVFV